MAANHDSGLGHGTQGAPQTTIEEQEYSLQQSVNEAENETKSMPKYSPSPKHESGHNWGSVNPIKTQEEGQHLLNTGYTNGKQIYNVTSEGKIVKFQPDNTPQNGYHSYEVSKPKDIPITVLRKMLADSKITKSEYKKLSKGEK